MARKPHHVLTIPELRSLGYKVYVRHERRWRFVLDAPIPDYLIATLRQGAEMLGDAMVRGHWEIDSYGGRTTVTVQRGDEVVAVGEARTNDIDIYRKREGLTKALGRVQGELLRVGLLERV